LAIVVGVFACLGTVAATAQQPTPAPVQNPPVSVTLTCAEMRTMLRAGTGGLAILWLDGYYAGRVGLPELSADWADTITYTVGTVCAVARNNGRQVLEIIARAHRDRIR
jgi:hypothetical protein